MRFTICKTGIFEHQLNQVELQFGADASTVSQGQINEMMMVSNINKVTNQEKALDMYLMQLCLVDVATGHNSQFKMRDEASCTNSMIAYILSSNISYKLIYNVIRMTSINFLKPFQLQTVMCYAEIKYHSNDYTFMQIMADVLNVSKMQLKYWKEEANAKKAQSQEESKQIEPHAGLNKYNPGANTHLVKE